MQDGKERETMDDYVGTSPSYVNRLIKSPEKIVNKTFVQMMEQLGYDIELTYVKKTK